MDSIDIRNLTAKWFSDATPKNYKDASTTIGSGTDGVVFRLDYCRRSSTCDAEH